MAHVFKVSVDGELSERESERIAIALQKSLAKWFKKGHSIKVEH